MHSSILRVHIEGIESGFPVCTTEHFKSSKHFCVRCMKTKHFRRPDPMISGQAQNMTNAQLMTAHERSLKFMQEFFIKNRNNFAERYSIPLTMEPYKLFPFLNQSYNPSSSSSANKTSLMQNKLPF